MGDTDHKWGRNLSGRDRVALLLAYAAAISVLLLAAAAFSDVWIDPAEGLSAQIVSLLTSTLGVMIGGLVGYVGGRRVDRTDGPESPDNEIDRDEEPRP